MALVMGVLIFAGALGLAAYSAAKGEIPLSGHNRDRKQAYAAAEAGVNFYQSRLNVDDNYWTKCWSNNTPGNGVDPVVNRPGTSPLQTRLVAPSSTARYGLEVLPAATGACNGSTMLDDNGVFRIRSTGFYNGVKRSIVARFRREKFLDFIYFTKYETTDPLAYDSGAVDWAKQNCGDRYRTQRNALCTEIQFRTGDAINGPLHSNDSLLICGTPTFGRAGRKDRIETFANPGTKDAGCGGAPNFRTPLWTGAKELGVPDTNGQLKTSASAVYYGKTTITLKGSTYDVTTASGTQSKAWPANGLIYVDTGTGSCTGGQVPRTQTYSESSGCANVTVTGTYSKDLTIASARDVVVRGNVTRTGGIDAMLGLIANQFVRVYHPVDRSHCTDGTRVAGVQPDVTIDAAILSLQHGFTVDNFDCGTGLGTLTVNGAIAQMYRGAVGTSGGRGTTGYTKNYVYDDRMRYRNPPLFLDPVNAAWKIQRMNEQVPAP